MIILIGDSAPCFNILNLALMFSHVLLSDILESHPVSRLSILLLFCKVCKSHAHPHPHPALIQSPHATIVGLRNYFSLECSAM